MSRHWDVARWRVEHALFVGEIIQGVGEIVYDIQRYLAEQVYYQYGPSVSTVAAWEPHVKNFAPNIGHDYGGRLMAAWLDK